MARTTAEHAAAGEELVGSLAVVIGPKGKQDVTEIKLVHGGLKDAVLLGKRAHYNYDLFSYIQSAEINDRIVACLQRSSQACVKVVSI